MHRRAFVLAATLTLGLTAACGERAAPSAEASTAPQAAQAAAGGDTLSPADTLAREAAVDFRAAWTPERTFHGDGFTLGYPAASRVQMRDPDDEEKSAIEVARLPGCTVLCFLTVRTYDDPSRQGTAAWVRALAHDDSAQTTEDDDPQYDDPPQPVKLGGVTALRLEHTCEDCTWLEYWVARGDRVVDLELILDGRIPPADQDALIAKVQQMLGSFRWDPSSHEEPVAPASPEGIET
jgi:hypothetical protein